MNITVGLQVIPQAGDMKPMSVTGCVAENDGHFMLDHAMKSSDMKGDMKTDTKHDDMKAMSYGLMGGTLKPHVGHKVEVTGTMDSKMMSKDKMATDKMMDKDKMPMAEMAGTINVTAVKMLSASCP